MKRVITLRGFVQTLERKCQEMKAEINTFRTKFAALQNRGLPSLLTSRGKMLTHDQYARRVDNYVSNQITTSSSSSEQARPPSRQILYDKLESMFFIEHEIIHLFEVEPNFYRYTEADETLIKIQRHQLPTEDWWQSMLEILPR